MQAYEVIARLEGTSSKIEKEAIVTEAFEAGCYDFFRGAQLAYDKKVTFGTKTVPDHKTLPVIDTSLTWDDFTILTDMLRKRHVTGGDATTAMEVTAEHCDEQMWEGFYKRVLMKDLRCGVTESTINKALTALVKAGNKEAEKFLVPVFSCQLAHPRDKFEKLMKGKKLIDLKLDGARILAVCDKENGTVTLHTRNGLVKENFPHIEKLLVDRLIPKLTRSVVLDGEMVAKTFKALMEQLNRKSNVDTSDINYAIFDCIPLDAFLAGKCNITQVERDKAAQWAVRTVNDDHVYHIEKEMIDLDTPEGVARLEEFHRNATLAGFEGTMVKDPEAPYVTKRSNAWLKIKPMVTVDLQILELELGTPGKKYENCTGRIHCAGYDAASGKFIRVSPGEGTDGSMTDQDRIDFWNRREELRGLTVEIIGHEISQDENGVYSIRHPRLVCFRPDKDGTEDYDKSVEMIKTELGIDLAAIVEARNAA